MPILSSLVSSHLSLTYPGSFLHKGRKCKQLCAGLGARCQRQKIFQTSVPLAAKIRVCCIQFTVVRFVWWVTCDFNLSDFYFFRFPCVPSGHFILPRIFRSTLHMSQGVWEGQESYMSLPCLHQEGRSWEISPKFYPKERTSAPYT